MNTPDLLAYLHEQFARLHLRLDELVRWTTDADRHLTGIECALSDIRQLPREPRHRPLR